MDMRPVIYDPRKVNVGFNNVPITGFADTLINITRAEDNYFPRIGAQGDAVLARNANRSGLAEMTLLHNSESIPYCRELAESGEFFNLSISDANGPDYLNISTPNAVIIKVPDAPRGKEVGDFNMQVWIPYLEFHSRG